MKQLLKRIFYILPKGDPIKMVILSFLMILGAMMEIVGISAIPGFIVVIINPEKLASISALKGISDYISHSEKHSLLINGSIILALVFLLKNLYIVWLESMKAKYVFNRQIFLVNRLFKGYLFAPFYYHLNKNSGIFLSNINQEVALVVNGILLESLNLIMNMLFLGGIIGLLLTVDFYTTLASFSVLGLSTWLFLRMTSKKTNKLGKLEMLHRGLRNKIVMHGIGGIKENKILQNENFFLNEFKNSTFLRTRAMKYKYIITMLPKPFIETIAVISILIIIMSFSLQGKELQNLVPIMALYGTAAVKLLPMLRAMITSYSTILYNKHAITPIYNDVIEIENINSSSVKQNLKSSDFNFNETIEFKNIMFTYPKTEDLIINDFNFKIQRGEVIGIVGKTGSGKTTIVDIMMGLLKTDSGQVLVDKKDISEYNSQWLSHLGYVPQNIFLADDTIKNNIAYGINEDKIDLEQLEFAIQAAQLSEFLDNLPQGINTLVGERGVRLSGGQRQRIGIARALYLKPSVLIMDEATSALDNKTEKAVISSIDFLKGKITLVIIAHRLTTVKKCDKIIVLEKGLMKAVGTYDELIETSSFFKEIAKD